MLGGEPPEGFNYELFLDEKGQKISKSKGNGLTIDEWLHLWRRRRAWRSSCISKPREAKRLYFDVIPRPVDEYQQLPRRLSAPGSEAAARQSGLAHPCRRSAGAGGARHRCGGASQISFALLLNLVAVANAETKDVLWGFIRRYAPGVSPETHPRLDALVGYAIRYFQDFVKPAKTYRSADAARARGAGRSCRARVLRTAARTRRAEEIQQAVYDVGRARSLQDVQEGRDAGAAGVSLAWFNTLYQVLLGEEKGPRFGSFVALYGIDDTRALIAKALVGRAHAEHKVVPRRAHGGRVMWPDYWLAQMMRAIQAMSFSGRTRS